MLDWRLLGACMVQARIMELLRLNASDAERELEQFVEKQFDHAADTMTPEEFDAAHQRAMKVMDEVKSPKASTTSGGMDSDTP